MNPKTVDAWRALESTLTATGYDVHRAWVYVCRNIAGEKAASLHAYGLAIDIDHAGPRCNVNNPTPDRRKVRFSTGSTKSERCRDVQRGAADTAFTVEQVAAVEAIRTIDGHQVFAWGGRWPTTKDTMHFQINVTPAELARGIAAETVGKVGATRIAAPTLELSESVGSLGTTHLVTFTARTLPLRVSVLVTKAAQRASRVEVLLFAHGLDVCGPLLKPRPQTFVTGRPLELGAVAEASGRPIVLIVPFLDWENLNKNKMAFGNKWHKLGKPENFNGVVAEALERVGAPTIERLILAGHSRAFGVFDALARAHANPEMVTGALGRLSHVWALDSTYTSPVADWASWLQSRSELRATVIYRYATYFSEKAQKTVSLPTGIHGARFRPLTSTSGGRLTVSPVAASSVSHCAIPSKYLPGLLAALPAPSASDEREAIHGEWFDEPRTESDYALASNGLTAAEFKAVQITSTLETGTRGGFHGLSGNFDGYGISFGLVNWNIGTGSLQPLLRDFAANEPARWRAVFGSNASSFAALIAPTGANAVRGQLRYAIEHMNTRRIVKGKTVWSVNEPWVTYFKRLSEDSAFQAIQVQFVRKLLDRARHYCEYFGLKSEMSFTFMFDAVSSHGPWWLEKKWKNGGQKRRELLRPRLVAMEGKYGKGNIPEDSVLLAIADVLAETSSERWRDNVKRRKYWFVTGKHPRAAELHGLTPRPDVAYQNSVRIADESPPLDSSVQRVPAAVAARSNLVGAAHRQAVSAGSDADRRAIASTLRANGTDAKRWFEAMVPDATFLGRPIRASGGDVPGVHRALFEVLKRAERALLQTHSGRTAHQLGQQFGIYDIAGLRPPKKATGGSLPSYHCFGLAIDINHDTNPFVGNMKPAPSSPRAAEFSANRSPRVIARALWLLHGEHFDIEGKALADHLQNSGAAKAWDLHHRASNALAEYLQLADDLGGTLLRDLVATAQSRGAKEDLEWWKRRINTDRSVLKYWDFPKHQHPQKTGYMDLPRELVTALSDAGLLWGGMYRSAKDIMHFDLRDGPIRYRPPK
ncbi:MAG: M15 family metallopeptidase [Mycobacterium sp.]